MFETFHNVFCFLLTVNLLKTNQNILFSDWTRSSLFYCQDLALDLLLHSHSFPQSSLSDFKRIFFCQRESNPTTSNNDFVGHALTSYLYDFKHLQNHHRLNLKSHNFLSSAALFAPSLFRHISLKNWHKQLKYWNSFQSNS